MHATYDPQARAIAIQLEDDARQDRTDEVAPGAIAGLRDGRIVELELIGIGSSDDLDRIAAVSARYDLDLEAVTAAFRAALAAPGRRVSITVTARAA